MSHFDMPLQPHERLPLSMRLFLWAFLLLVLGGLIGKVIR